MKFQFFNCTACISSGYLVVSSVLGSTTMKHSCGSRRLSRVVLVQNVSASSTLGQVHTVVNVAHVYAYVYYLCTVWH